jgi:hypothetical protein
LLLTSRYSQEARTGGNYVGASELIKDPLRVAKESSKRLTVAAVADSAASPFSEGELTF